MNIISIASNHQDSIHHELKLQNVTFSAFIDDRSFSRTVNSKDDTLHERLKKYMKLEDINKKKLGMGYGVSEMNLTNQLIYR